MSSFPPSYKQPYSWKEVLRRHQNEIPLYVLPLYLIGLGARQTIDPDRTVWTYQLIFGRSYGLQKTCWKVISQQEYNESFSINRNS